jgi:hypothetical protein
MMVWKALGGGELILVSSKYFEVNCPVVLRTNKENSTEFETRHFVKASS